MKDQKLKEQTLKNHFEDIDHDKISKFHDEMEKDEQMKQQFIQDPHKTLKEKGISLPEGVRANYDHQYIKPSDGSKSGMYGYRIGNIGFSK